MSVVPVLKRIAVASSVPVGAVDDVSGEVLVSVVTHVASSVDNNALSISIGGVVARSLVTLTLACTADVLVGDGSLNQNLMPSKALPVGLDSSGINGHRGNTHCVSVEISGC